LIGAFHDLARHTQERRKHMAASKTTSGKRGVELLHDPTLNKSTAFAEAEKQALGIVGLVPDVTESTDVQLNRVRMQLGAKTTDLERYIYLINLLDHNETLFYRTVMSDPAYFLPIVYDPTIGEACLKFGHIYRETRGITAGITLTGMINAAKLKGKKLKDEKYLFLGAGSAGIGLANLLCSALVGQGMSLKDAQSRVYMFDIHGLLEPSRTDLVDFQKPYAHKHAPTKDFVAAIRSIKPTTIIGVSTVGGAFTKQVVEAMSEINERPVILALSNPTEKAECTPEQAYTWSKGKAIYAAGVQFTPVHYDGHTFLPGQANNFYIFPAVGMAIFATQAKRVTDEMFIEAGQAVADQVPTELLKQGLLYPLQSNVLETEIKTAARVAKLVFDSKLAQVDRPADMEAFIRSHVYKPEYPAEAAGATKAA
jgi:malic enzyme